MDIDFSKFKSNKSEPSVKAESHSEKSIKKPEKDNSSPSIHDINKSDDKKETSKRKEFSKNDYTVLGAIQEETEKLSATSIDSLYEKNKPKRLKSKNNRNNSTTASAKGQIVLDFGKQYDKYEGYAIANGKKPKKNADIFIKYVFGEDTYLHAGNKNKEDDVEGDEKTIKNNGDENATPWCASFVSYVLENSGIEVPEWYNSIEKEKKALVQNVYVAARDNDALIEKSEVKPGDLIMLDRNNDGIWYDHIAFVKSIDEDGTINTLEGNAPKKSKTEDGVEKWKDDQGIVKEKSYPPDYEEKNNTTFAFARIN